MRSPWRGTGGRTAAHDPGDDDGTVPLVHLDADPDERAGERLVGALALLRRHERGVPRIVDGPGEAVDGAVGQVAAVEVRRSDVLLVEEVPGLADQRGRRRPVWPRQRVAEHAGRSIPAR
jgi:hypothetical protein